MKKHILIVDDEFGLADVVAEILAESGYEAEIAINGAQALARLAEKRADLILLDFMMPVLDGMGMLRILRADSAYASTPVIIMTALPESLPIQDRSFFQGVLAKPFSPQELLNMVEKLLRD